MATRRDLSVSSSLDAPTIDFTSRTAARYKYLQMCLCAPGFWRGTGYSSPHSASRQRSLASSLVCSRARELARELVRSRASCRVWFCPTLVLRYRHTTSDTPAACAGVTNIFFTPMLLAGTLRQRFTRKDSWWFSKLRWPILYPIILPQTMMTLVMVMVSGQTSSSSSCAMNLTLPLLYYGIIVISFAI